VRAEEKQDQATVREKKDRKEERKEIGMTKGLKDLSRVFSHYVPRCFRLAVPFILHVNRFNRKIFIPYLTSKMNVKLNCI
jgi:hypothetical protein